MKRLRDKETGEVYGWNFHMAKLPELEEIDDEVDLPEDFVPFSKRGEGASDTAVSEEIEVTEEAKAAAAQAQAEEAAQYADDEYKDVPTEQMTDAQFATLSPTEQQRRIDAWNAEHPEQEAVEDPEPEPEPKKAKKK